MLSSTVADDQTSRARARWPWQTQSAQRLPRGSASRRAAARRTITMLMKTRSNALVWIGRKPLRRRRARFGSSSVRSGMAAAHSLTAPKVRPATMCRCTRPRNDERRDQGQHRDRRHLAPVGAGDGDVLGEAGGDGARVERWSASRRTGYSFQAKTQVRIAVTARPGRASGMITSRQHLPRSAPSTDRGLVELLRDAVDDAAQRPDRERQVEDAVEQDQPDAGVVELPVADREDLGEEQEEAAAGTPPPAPCGW